MSQTSQLGAVSSLRAGSSAILMIASVMGLLSGRAIPVLSSALLMFGIAVTIVSYCILSNGRRRHIGLSVAAAIVMTVHGVYLIQPFGRTSVDRAPEWALLTIFAFFIGQDHTLSETARDAAICNE